MVVMLDPCTLAVAVFNAKMLTPLRSRMPCTADGTHTLLQSDMATDNLLTSVRSRMLVPVHVLAQTHKQNMATDKPSADLR